MTLARPQVAVLVGPTGIGKTALAIRLAQATGAEIVSADSLQVYRYLDIGTAKPSAGEQAAVRHHLLDVVDPDEPFNAATYMERGRQVLADLHGRGIPPLVVGGTGLYIRALLWGLFPAAREHGEVRRRLHQELVEDGPEALHQRLGQLDPAAAARIASRDAFRILRALEVVTATGRPLSAWQQEHRFADRPYQVLTLGLRRDRPELYARIEARVEAMLSQGLLREVENLLGRYDPGLKPLQALGYRHLIRYLQGRSSWLDAVAQMKTDTRRYAKRQLTWFQADPEVLWLHPEQEQEALELTRQFFSTAFIGSATGTMLR